MKPFLAIFIMHIIPVFAGTEILVPKGSEWHFLDIGSHPGSNWTNIDHDTSSWKKGRARFGFGNDGEVTLLEKNGKKKQYISYYFRKSFEVKSFNPKGSIIVNLICDDGGAVYINGTKIIHQNMPNKISNSTRALLSVSGENENKFVRYILPSSMLTKGSNQICAEVHQQSREDEDLAFNLELSLSQERLSEQTAFITTNITKKKEKKTALKEGKKREEREEINTQAQKSISKKQNPSQKMAQTTTSKQAAVIPATKKSSLFQNLVYIALVCIYISFFITSFLIFPRAGYPASMAFLNIIPFAGQVAVTFILAFQHWPVHKDFSEKKKYATDLKNYLEYESN